MTALARCADAYEGRNSMEGTHWTASAAQSESLEDLPLIAVLADVCRSELLIEIETVALVANRPPPSA